MFYTFVADYRQVVFLRMKKGFYTVIVACGCMLLLETACKNRRPADTGETEDSVTCVVDTDTVAELVSDQEVPKAADELFDDFFFTFAGNRKHQMSRILFPLPVKSGNKVTMMEQHEWRMDRFFMPQNYYTLILDSRKQLNLPKDTSVNHVVVEKIFLDKSWVKGYHFDRINGEWKLTSIENQSVAGNANASFLNFYQNFATDSLYQAEHLNDVISFKGPDPDNDLKDLVGEISADEWEEMGPGELPRDMIYNIIYGQTYEHSNQRIFVLRGISNGQEMELTFRRSDGEWKLVKIVE